MSSRSVLEFASPVCRIGAALVFCALTIAFGTKEATSATVSFQTESNGAALFIGGPIVSGDFSEVRNTVSDLNTRGLVVFKVYLNSPGGNVEEAIRIGRYLREIRAATVAPEKTDEPYICASACSLIWVGGIYRIGRVHFHRAFIADEDGTLEFNDWDQALSGSRQDIKTYLSQMRIPVWVDDLLNSVPSTSTRAVDGTDIGVFDPVFEEFVLSKCGSGLSIDETEVLRDLEERENRELDPDPIHIVALRLLREKQDSYIDCGREWLFESQRSAQLGD